MRYPIRHNRQHLKAVATRPRSVNSLKLTGDNLAASLSRGLSSLYLVTGDDPLLVGEACDAIRVRARAAGYASRDVHAVGAGFDWDALRADTRSLSLFAERRIIEIRLATASPGDGAELFAELAAEAPADLLVIVVAPKLDGRALGTRWATAIEKHGVVVQIWPLPAERLPAWIRERLQRQGVTADLAAATLLAERVEGNLLAAQQEVDKLALLQPGATLSGETVLDAVADSARFDALQLGEAAMRGQAARALRILRGLRDEGEEAPRLLWLLAKDLQWMVRVSHLVRQGQNVEAAMNAEYVWRPRQPAMRAALARCDGTTLQALLIDAARVDRAIKGALRRDPWLELEALVARLSGVALARAA